MKRLIAIMMVCLMSVSVYAGDNDINWSIESGSTIDWASMIAQVDTEIEAVDSASSSLGVVTPATPGTIGVGVDLAAKKGESTKLTGKQWWAIIGGGLVAGRVVYHNRDKLGLGSSGSSKPSAASASFNQANTDNTHSHCDFRGAVFGDGATIDCHDSSSRQ